MTNEERFGFPTGLETVINEEIKAEQRKQAVHDFEAFHKSWLTLKASLAKYILPDEQAELERIAKQINTSIDFLADLTD